MKGLDSHKKARTWEVAQWVKYLLHKYEALDSDPSTHVKAEGMERVMCAYNSSTRGTGRRRQGAHWQPGELKQKVPIQ